MQRGDEIVDAYHIPVGRVVGHVEFYSDGRLVGRAPAQTVDLIVKDGELIAVDLKSQVPRISWTELDGRQIHRHARSHPDRRDGWGVFATDPTTLVAAAWRRGHGLGLVPPPTGAPGTGAAQEMFVPMGRVIGHIDHYDSTGIKTEAPTRTIKIIHKNGQIQAAEPVPDRRVASVPERATNLLGGGTERYAADVLTRARTSWNTEFPERGLGSREAALDAAFAAGSGGYVEMVALNPIMVQGPPTREQTNDPTWRRASTFTRYGLHNRGGKVTVTNQDAGGVEVARGHPDSPALTAWLDSVSPFVRYALKPDTPSYLTQLKHWLQGRDRRPHP